LLSVILASVLQRLHKYSRFLVLLGIQNSFSPVIYLGS